MTNLTSNLPQLSNTLEKKVFETKYCSFFLFWLFLVSMWLAMPQSANAGSRIYPATMCQLWGGNMDMRDSLSYSQHGGVMNTHDTERLVVVCPVPRAANVEFIQIWFTDQNPIGTSDHDISCRLRSNWSFGDASYSSYLVTGSSSGAGSTSRDSWYFYPSNTASYVNNNNPSNYTFFCSIPPRYNGKMSSIGSILVKE